MKSPHKFHIPVMGIGFTIDTPLKVAHLGIDSVIFISDDILLEKMRKMYAEKYNFPFTPIDESEEDYRAKRITAYLDLIHDLIQINVKSLSNPLNVSGRTDYFELLPDDSKLKAKYFNFISTEPSKEELGDWLVNNLVVGSIDVNIMTKLDKENYRNKEKLSQEYNDAHAALRGFANSKIEASVVFSAGMNPRLYSYAENLKDLFPDENGRFKKRIILKVSDYRSALIQGKFLAKKGLWVSEYRIESGLNCGGHAFATDGFLMGPILQEFKNNRNDLYTSTRDVLDAALLNSGLVVNAELPIQITAQGGVGTYFEQQFLLDNFNLDRVGWGSPFLLVPEATNVDEETMSKLMQAKEKDLYLSNISPLGVPFNNLRGSSKELQRLQFIAKGRPGSSCPKKYLSLNKEFTDEPICTASRQYQHLKLEQMKDEMSQAAYEVQSKKVMESSCLCVGLGTTALIINEIDRKVEGDGVLICPGPNMAYFSKKVSLKQMVDHIYGRENIIEREDRPHMFIKELALYVDYLRNKIIENVAELNSKEKMGLIKFVENLRNGINFYYELFMGSKFDNDKELLLDQLAHFSLEIDQLEEVLLTPTKLDPLLTEV